MNKIFEAIQNSSTADLLEFSEMLIMTHSVAKLADDRAGWVEIEAGELAESLFYTTQTEVKES